MKSIEVGRFGDVRELNYNDANGNTEAVGTLSTTDVERLLLGIADAYAGSRSKRGTRIRELATELAKEYYRDSGLNITVRAHVAIGKTIVLDSPRLTTDGEPLKKLNADLKALSKKVR